ncbi:hydroxyisourate hydrolase [Rhodococcoides kyotonense]|uniref:5-hydroxyisourate hydrolase n=1 Tax=Rhodococcoides kyotonense TaxID=398843 RepID=A0A239MSJ8_9NOCA|nr:hydroxyisourate hydrolase [Rhodococcus kyotonensis]SNT45711.1 5-hydroxyisourate hydrolase [Rhodococcus kyotonensis]
MSGISTHVLDAATGTPAVGMHVRLMLGSHEFASNITDSDGRILSMIPALVESGTYRLVFDTGAYFAATATETFYPEVSISFTVVDPLAHHHVPLLLSPFAYSTYRGS